MNFLAQCILQYVLLILTIATQATIPKSPKIIQFRPIHNNESNQKSGSLVDRRQAYGYSASIVHYGNGDNKQHAVSEIKVNLNHESPPIPIRTNSKNNMGGLTRNVKTQQITATTNIPYRYSPPKSTKLQNHMQLQPQKGYLQIDSNSNPLQSSPASKTEQNSFNVGYSIGFGSSLPNPEPSDPSIIYLDNTKPQQPSKLYYQTADIVTGKPSEKVPKPPQYQQQIVDNMKPKDFVLNAIESFQKQGVKIPQTGTKPTPSNSQDQSYNSAGLKSYYSSLTESNYDYNHYQSKNPSGSTYLSKIQKAQPFSYKNNEEDDSKWKIISPTLEIASASNSGRHFDTTSDLQHYSNNGQRSSGTREQKFDHENALGRSQGFDYSNVLPMDGQPNQVSQSAPSEPTSVVSYQIQNKPTVTTASNLEVDKSLLDTFNNNYKPIPINWFNSDDAITKENDETPAYPLDTSLIKPVPVLTKTPVKTPTSGTAIPIHFDTTLLQKAIDALNSQDGSSTYPSQPNAVFMPPPNGTASYSRDSPSSTPSSLLNEVQPKIVNGHQINYQQYIQMDEKLQPKNQVARHVNPQQSYSRQHYRNQQANSYNPLPNFNKMPQLESYNYNSNRAPQQFDESRNYRYHSHQDQSDNSDQQQTRQTYSVSYPNFQRHTYLQSQHQQRDNPNNEPHNGDQYGSYSTQMVKSVPSIPAPVEEIIKGKHKKPGVVRHPKLLNGNLKNNKEQHIPPQSSVTIIRSLSPQQQSTINYNNYGTSLRPPPRGHYFVQKKPMKKLKKYEPCNLRTGSTLHQTKIITV